MKLVTSLIAWISLIGLISCGTHNVRTIHNYETNPIVDGLRLSQIKKAIQTAGTKRGWVIKSGKKRNELMGHLTVRGHQMTIKIPYTNANYKLIYVNSINMKYDPKTQYIHKKYFWWSELLIKSINKELLAL